LREAQFEVPYTQFLSILAEVLLAAGRIDESIAAADEAIERAERNDASWWMPEALRIKGEIVVRADTSLAEELFSRSLEMASRQGALSLEPRTAMSFN
jgi:predicted ATPase